MRIFPVAIAAAALVAGTNAYAAHPIAVAGTEGLAVIAGVGEIIATYEGNSAAYSNDLYLENTGQFIFNNQASPVGSTVNLGSFAPGTELIFRLYVNNTANSFFTGLASRNPDGQAHARVEAGWMPDTTLVSFEDLLNGPFDYNDLSFSFTNTFSAPGAVPEPSTWAMMILGFGAVGGVLRRRRKVSVRYAF